MDVTAVPHVQFVQAKRLSEQLTLDSATQSPGRGNGSGDDVPAWQAGEPAVLQSH